MNAESRVTIVMYHYVRELPVTPYPEIKGLRTSEFEAQLAYMQQHYNFTTVEEVMSVLQGRSKHLPDNAALLTFDDGYTDHYSDVFPLLQRLGIQGSFFPPARVIAENTVLDVNKIHFLLASTPIEQLVEHLLGEVEGLKGEHGAMSSSDYLARYGNQVSRWDSSEVIFFKTMLQKALPEAARGRILDRLFEEHIGVSESVFSHSLYMSVEQMGVMRRSGMAFGSHGYGHYWLGTLSYEQQLSEIRQSMEFLEEIGVSLNNWIMCYPYGSYNQDTLKILKRYGCGMGFTTKVDVAVLGRDACLELPRLDTNDLPKAANAPPNDWYQKNNETMARSLAED